MQKTYLWKHLGVFFEAICANSKCLSWIQKPILTRTQPIVTLESRYKETQVHQTS